MGIPPTNKKVTYWAIDAYRFVGDKIAEIWARADTLGVMQQVGVMPKAGKG
jgi:predicted ester cyclase